ncbi:MAG: hypothetical protein JW939_03400 [Candidatus Thermoplasmatota archaeon]|nr:hypothetical protein [Candidatus Thermoplasmatota archaeon]
MKQNCWEFNRCGRTALPDPDKDKEVCLAATSLEYDSRNSGKNGGRCCWRVPSTMCTSNGGTPVPNWADKIKDCINCVFLKKVMEEEGPDFRI